MSSTVSSTLFVDVSARRWERRIAVFVLFTALAAPWLLEAATVTRGCTSVVAGLIVGFLLHRAGWLAAGASIHSVVRHADGSWELIEPTGRRIEAELHPGTRIGAHWVWLRWRAERSRSMLLLRADVTADDLRRLVVRLRFATQDTSLHATPPIA
jgi:hypothetical protein